MNLETMTLQEIWQVINRKASEKSEVFQDLEATFAFNITGDDGGDYRLSIQNGEAKVMEGNIEGADCTLSMNFKNFKKLLQGNLNATTAFMTGRLKVKGNISLALKLENLLKKFSI